MASITLHLPLRSELGLRIQIADGLTDVNIAPFLYEGYCYSRWLLRRGSRWIRAGLRASYKKVFLQREIIPSGGKYETDTVRGRVYLQRRRCSKSWRNKVDFPLSSGGVGSSEGNSIRGTRDRGRVPARAHGGHSRHEVIIEGEESLE